MRSPEPECESPVREEGGGEEGRGEESLGRLQPVRPLSHGLTRTPPMRSYAQTRQHKLQASPLEKKKNCRGERRAERGSGSQRSMRRGRAVRGRWCGVRRAEVDRGQARRELR